jgi:hypothetical protein
MQDTTLVIALDKPHLQELRLSAPTWFRHWKELNKCPLLVFVDEAERPEWWAKQMGEFMSHPDATIVPWPVMPGVDQRSRMISAFVHGVADYCETTWHLKIDTDTACMARDERCFPGEWFADDVVFMSHKWGYTKPAAKHLALVEWAKSIRAFDGAPEAPVTWEGDPAKVKCFHKRIMSCLFLGRTDFVKEVSGLCRDHGPAIPGGSHDGLVWYVATRLRRKWLRTSMNKLGWVHGARRLEQRCVEAMK